MCCSVPAVSVHKNITKNPLGSYPQISLFHVVYRKLQSHATTHLFLNGPLFTNLRYIFQVLRLFEEHALHEYRLEIKQ
jgi:hypothetical protein